MMMVRLIGFTLFVSLFFNVSLMAQRTMVLKTIVIDPGHGGKDPGASGKYAKEKDITLKVALKLGSYIKESSPDIKVVYTREKDVSVDLDERAKIANKNKADLFISIHANAISTPNTQGTETFVLGLHRSQDNLEVAKKENSVIVLEDDYHTKYEGFDPNLAESYIIFELLQNAYLDQSIEMASLIEKQFSMRAGRHSRGVKQAGFLVLRETSMPSVLVEVGFLTNANEEKYIATDEGQSVIASAIFRAFKEYKLKFESKSLIADGAEMISQTVNNNVTTKKNNSVVYRIQIGLSKHKLKDVTKSFPKITDVWMYEESNIYKYTTGSSGSFDEMKEQLVVVKKTYPDAFVVAFENNKRIPIDKAKKISQK